MRAAADRPSTEIEGSLYAPGRQTIRAMMIMIMSAAR
jgi:hypothetical protein